MLRRRGADAVVHGPRGAVGGDGGDDDGREGHRDRPREHAPQDEAGPGAGGPDGEQDDRAGAEGHRDGRQHGETQELGAYVGLRQRGAVREAGRPCRPPSRRFARAAGARR